MSEQGLVETQEIERVEVKLGGIARLIEVYAEIEDLESRLDAAKRERDAIKSLVLQDFQSQGISKTTVNGRTAYLSRQIWASVAGAVDEVKAALVSLGVGHMVKETINTQTLSAYVREFESDDQGMPDLPAELKGLVKVTEKFDIRVVKG